MTQYKIHASNAQLSFIDISDDNTLRFIQRVLESSPSKKDMEIAHEKILEIRTRVRSDFQIANEELLQIHAITQCVAECPPVTDSDTATVKAVKCMAFEMQYLEAMIKKLKKE